jgi:hypothetical protein
MVVVTLMLLGMPLWWLGEGRCDQQASGAATAISDVERTVEAKTWRTILHGIEKDLDLRIRQSEALRRMLPDMKNALGDALAKADNRLDQLVLLRGVAGETPWAFRSILIQLRELERFVKLKRVPLDDRQARLAQAKKDYASIRAIRKKGLTLDYAADTTTP